MDITLTSELEQIIRERIASGLYNSATEVVREALHLIEERDRYLAIQRASLRRDVEAGIEQLDRGESVTSTPAEVLERVESRLR